MTSDTSELFAALQRAGDRVAISFSQRTLTYSELRDAALRVADALAGAQRVAVLAEPQPETCVAVIGALLAGVPIVPVNPKSGSAELGHIASDAAPEAVLARPGATVPAAFSGRSWLTVDLDDERPPSSHPVRHSAGHNQP